MGVSITKLRSVYKALKMGRRGITCELKDSYFDQLKANLEIAASESPNVFPVGSKSVEDL